MVSTGYANGKYLLKWPQKQTKDKKTHMQVH